LIPPSNRLGQVWTGAGPLQPLDWNLAPPVVGLGPGRHGDRTGAAGVKPRRLQWPVRPRPTGGLGLRPSTDPVERSTSSVPSGSHRWHSSRSRRSGGKPPAPAGCRLGPGAWPDLHGDRPEAAGEKPCRLQWPVRPRPTGGLGLRPSTDPVERSTGSVRSGSYRWHCSRSRRVWGKPPAHAGCQLLLRRVRCTPFLAAGFAAASLGGVTTCAPLFCEGFLYQGLPILTHIDSNRPCFSFVCFWIVWLVSVTKPTGRSPTPARVGMVRCVRCRRRYNP
jgi:hypothetical protein